jgi:hypothetical protein
MPHDSERHARHDQLLVVALAAGDLTGTERDRAAAQVASCVACASLNDDLIAIARATAVLPAAVAPRDFRLSPEQAARLRPSGWRRLIAAFASPRLAMTRQLGVGLTTIGIAGLLVSVLPTMHIGLGGGAAAPAGNDGIMAAPDEFQSSNAQSAPSAAAAPAASTAPESAPAFGGNAAASPLASSGGIDMTDRSTATSPASGEHGGGVAVQGSKASPSDARLGVDAADRDLAADEPGVSLVLVASAILLAAGVAMLLARRIARGMTRG